MIATPRADEVRLFTIAAWDGDTKNMTAFLDKYPGTVDITRGEPIGWTSLMWSAQSGNTDSISLLLDRGANIDGRDLNRQTPVMLAAARGHLHAVRLLIDRGADIAAEDKHGMTAADCAQSSGHGEIVALIGSVIDARERAAAEAARRKREELNGVASALQDKMREKLKSGKFSLKRGRA